MLVLGRGEGTQNRNVVEVGREEIIRSMLL